MEVLDFLQAVGASVVGNCVWNIVVYVVKRLKEKL